MLLQDSDLEEAKFQILDFSADSSKEFRQLRIVEASDVPRLEESRKREMLSIFVDGFHKAQTTLSKTETVRENSKREIFVDENQLSLLD